MVQNTAVDDFGGISPESRDLIGRLLVREPSQRIEAARHMESHPFFLQVGPWKDLPNVTMPFIPCPDDNTDTFYFEVWTSLLTQMCPIVITYLFAWFFTF